MSGRGGRDRFRRDYPPRSEERSHHGRSIAPPSRHLWVGNLPHNITESNLAHHFLEFGELESVAFQPSRSYAFINFKNDEDAFAAHRELQGFFVEGNPLKIEFAKAEKAAPSRDDDYLQRRDDQRSTSRGSPFSQRDSRARHSSPDPPYSDKSKMGDKNAEPSEVLWIGFPASLKVDEVILSRAFSPFGEIEKISAFPGRSYAFVRFKNVMSACRAKETLQGKLFGNPRVHICFAKSESSAYNSGRNSINGPPSPRFRSYGRPGSSENFRQDRYRDPNMRSPRFIPNLESGDPDVRNFDRKGNLWAGGNGGFEQRRFQDMGPEQGLPGSRYERHSTPLRERGNFREFSPPQQFPRKGPFYDDAWDLPEDALLFHGAKKLKTNSSYPPENELPEYPFSNPEQVKRVIPRRPDFPQHEVHDKNFDSGPFGYSKQNPDRAMNLAQPYGERNENWNAPHYDGFRPGSVQVPPNPAEWKRSTPEPQQCSPNKEWKWEGTIAKGGTPVCRARCFPVGKVLDMILPEFLDCTARTGLDMLAKHYYQAASAYVVFFVPESDADMGFYNEFMNYLGEKQRAAVAKLDDKTTLFLVPPSEFSEKVLKVPGKLSISGVVLRLEQPCSTTAGSINHPQERRETNPMPFHGEPSYPKPRSPPGSYSSGPPFQNFGTPGANNLPLPPFSGTPINENRHEQIPHQRNPNRSPHNMQNPNLGNRTIMSSQASNNPVDTTVQGYNNSGMPRVGKETGSNNHTSGVTKPQAPSSTPSPVAALQPEQLAQLASSLFGQPRQPVGISAGEDFRQSSGVTNQSETSYLASSQKYGLPNNQVSPGPSLSQFGQLQQFQQQHQNQNQQTSGPSVSTQGNQQQQIGGAQDDADADPQKRLQATLQLAAALLQQIQQGKGN